MFTKVKTDKEIDNMRSSGKILARVLNQIKGQVAPGFLPTEADDIAKKEIKSMGAKPAFLGYQGFPAAICVSVNHEIVHGIPKKEPLKIGDLVSFDLGVSYNGMITDAAFTMVVGQQATSDVDRLLKGTSQALYAGIDKIRDGVRVGDIANAIEGVLTQNRLGIVRELVGHGVGHKVHEEPNIPNYGQAGTGPVLSSGMTIAIEPMATLGSEKIGILTDGWTVITTDASLSAHFEHTVLITDNGAEILTEMN